MVHYGVPHTLYCLRIFLQDSDLGNEVHCASLHWEKQIRIEELVASFNLIMITKMLVGSSCCWSVSSNFFNNCSYVFIQKNIYNKRLGATKLLYVEPFSSSRVLE